MPFRKQSPMSREQTLAGATRWFDSGNFQAELTRRVAWQTEGDGGAAGPQLRQYLDEEITPALSALGFACEVFDNPVEGGAPMLIARRIEDPALPTVLTYGHGDVVNGQQGKWRTGLEPWRLVVEGERWYGRGTADNKGQHSINFAALASVIAARRGRLGYNVTVLFEMGEEAGSPGLKEFCERERGRLHADLLIASDGPRVQSTRPTLFLGSRGLVNFTLSLKSRERAYHSGNWGGVLRNPAIVVAHAVASLTDARGRILVKDLLPPPLTEAMRVALSHIPVGGDADDPALDPRWGEPGLSPAEQLVGWNTLEVLALGAASVERPVNAIPPAATAHCQLRFVPGTRWQELQPIVRAYLDAHGFEDVDVRVTAATPATRLDITHPWVAWALRSMAASAGKPAVLLPNLAGSLPNDVFAQTLGLPTLWVPHSYPSCAQHAPNEHLLAPIAREGLQIMAGLYWDLGEPGLDWHRAP